MYSINNLSHSFDVAEDVRQKIGFPKKKKQKNLLYTTDLHNNYNYSYILH